MTLSERVKAALTATEKSDLDNLIGRCYYDGACEGVAYTANAYDDKLTEMKDNAADLRYYKVAESFVNHDMSDIDVYKTGIQEEAQKYREADKSDFVLSKAGDIDMSKAPDLERVCFYAYMSGREKATHTLSDKYNDKIQKTMDRIKAHKYHIMGEKVLDMKVPYIYNCDYAGDFTSTYFDDETSLGKDFPEKEKAQEKEQTQEPEKKKDHSHSR